MLEQKKDLYEKYPDPSERKDSKIQDEAGGFAKMLNTLRAKITWRVHLVNGNRYIYRRTEQGYFETLVGPENPKDTLRCKMEIRSHFRNLPPSLIDNLFNAILQDASRLIDGTKFVKARERGIPFLNGVFDFNRGTLRAYRDDDYYCDPIPHTFNTVIDKRHLRYFRERVREWVNRKEGNRYVGSNARWVIDLMAYILFIHPNAENIWVNPFGGGRNGKSSFIALLEELMGKSKSVGFNLSDLNRHSTASFVGKALIVGRDSDQFVSKRGTSLIKNYSGDKYVTVEPKGGFQYDALVEGVMVVSTNYLVRSQDRSFGWYRRLLPIPFPNTFPQDPNFEKRLFSHLPGILSYLVWKAWKLKHASRTRRLTERIPRDIQILRMDTQFLNDRVAAFWNLQFFDDDEQPIVDEFLKLQNKNMSEAFTAYKEWHHEYFGDDEKIEPGRNSFCGQHGAFMEKAGDYFWSERTRKGRILYLHDAIYEEWTRKDDPDPGDQLTLEQGDRWYEQQH